MTTTLTPTPLWKNTVLVINRDEWGGFFDHVAPPRVIAPNTVDTDIVDGKVLLGCRVPTLIVSPFTRGNPAKPRINSLRYDHASVLKLIEWRWHLDPLTARDASGEVRNLAWALNLAQPNFSVPSLPVIPEPTLDPCFLDTLETINQTTGLPTVIPSEALSVSQAENATGADEEIYDFYLMLRSDLMKGWPLPPSLNGILGAHREPKAPAVTPCACVCAQAFAANAIRPSEIVHRTLPCIGHPSNGVFFDFDLPSAARYVHSAFGSKITASAQLPTVSVPRPFSPSTAAGCALSRLSTRPSGIFHSLCSHRRQSPSAVSRPIMPFGARSNSTSFSCVACGAWSVAIASTTPSRIASIIASRSAADRSGGFIFACVS